jgi:FlaG/FlaF family flagellin (archaellin)
MVSVTVILAAVLYILVGGMLNTPEKPPEDVILLKQETTHQVDAIHFDTSFTITKVRSDQMYKITDLSFIIQGPSGSIVTDASFTYGDADGDGIITAGDSIQVTGMLEDYRGGTFKVLARGTMIGQDTIGW